MNKYYHKGNGECVLPEYQETTPTVMGVGFVNSKRMRSRRDSHISSLPITAHCPAEWPVGFLEGVGEGYQRLYNDEWIDCDGEVYDFLQENSMLNDYRIFLVKSEKGGATDNKQTAEQLFDAYTEGNANVATWTKLAVIEFAKEYHRKQLSALPESSPSPVQASGKGEGSEAGQEELWERVYQDFTDCWRYNNPTVDELKSKYHLTRK